MPNSMITALPLGEADRIALIHCANATFESVMIRMEPANEIAIRTLWSAEHYIDTLLHSDDLPISRDEVSGRVEATLVHHVLDLVGTADEIGGSPIH